MTTNGDYAQPDGTPRLFTYHCPGSIYPYVLAEAKRRGVSRNMAITAMIEEHATLAAKREARQAKK